MNTACKALSLLVLTMLLYGCTAEPSQTTPAGASPEREQASPQQSQQGIQEQQTQQAQQPSQPKPQIITEEAKALFSKNSKITSMRYLFHGPPNDALAYDITAAGTKRKIVSPKLIKLSDGVFYDVVYIDTVAKKATAYCESGSCTQPGPYDVDFSSYNFPTPADFVSTVSSAEAKGTELFENRKVTVVQYQDKSGNEGTLLVDTTYGAPLKVSFGSTKYEYRNPSFNTASEGEITPKSLT
ncbi:hypothetical protein HY640_04010 [Candidatus Woesearchaeota archaeon]|nr:hypothetical protein [Candidatus Woesearchaeota archaeon]